MWKLHLALVMPCNVYKQFINHRCDKTSNKIPFVSLKLHPLNQLNFNKVINKSTEHFRFNYFMILPFISSCTLFRASIADFKLKSFNFFFVSRRIARSTKSIEDQRMADKYVKFSNDIDKNLWTLRKANSNLSGTRKVRKK